MVDVDSASRVEVWKSTFHWPGDFILQKRLSAKLELGSTPTLAVGPITSLASSMINLR